MPNRRLALAALAVICCSLLSACTMGPVQRHDVNFNAYSLMFLVLAIGLGVAAAKADEWALRLFFSACCLGNFICWLDINSAAMGYWLVSTAPAMAQYSNFSAPPGSCGYLGHAVPRPCGDWHHQAPPSGATARCGDGTYSYSEHPYAPGTCSHHGGAISYLQ